MPVATARILKSRMKGKHTVSPSKGVMSGSGVAAGACPERSRRMGYRPADHSLGSDSVSRAWADPLHWRVYYYRLS